MSDTLSPMSRVIRHFLGWDHPFLPAAAKWLQEHYLQQPLEVVNDTLVLVSGRETGRQLQAILVANAATEDRALVLPSIETTKQCIDQLMVDRDRIANPTMTLVAMSSVLRTISPEVVEPIIGPRRPSKADLTAWYSLSKRVCSTLSTLTGGGLSPLRTSWSKDAQSLLTDAASRRFDALHAVQEHVKSLLLEDGFHLIDSKKMELLHGTVPPNVENIQHVVLVGTSDLAGMATKLVDRLCACAVSVDSLVRAPESESAHFDSYGCVDVEYWVEATIDIPEECIKVAGSPSNQAVSVVQQLSNIKDDYCSNEIVVSSTDETSIPIIRRHLSGCGVANRFAGGKPVLQFPAAVLLKALSTLVSTKTFSSFAAFVRHPDIVKYLQVQESTIKALDEYSSTFVPKYIDPSVWVTPKRKFDGREELVALHKGVFNLLQECLELQYHNANLSTCSSAIRSFLLQIYGNETLEQGDQHLASLQKLFGEMDRFDSLPKNVLSQFGNVDVATAANLILDNVMDTSIPDPPDVAAIETMGWLEAMTTCAPCLIVVGMSADLVGGNNPGDTYFPDTLRGSLGLETIDRRLARDAHAITAMQKVRAEHGDITWIVARKNIDGDPLTPSPLLLRCEDAFTLANRAKRLVVSLERELPEVPRQYTPETTGTGIQKPVPGDYPYKPLEKISVTAFKEYISCPYRFWLKYVLGLQVVEEGETELNPKLFGTLVHKTVERFGNNRSVRESCNVQEIQQALSNTLDAVVNDFFGDSLSGMVRVQVELARYRLNLIGSHQAKNVEEGWRILCSERYLRKELHVEGGSMIISGCIDRVDIHGDGRIRVLDYKTGATTANADHFKERDGQWINLQLPLYRFLLSEIPELEEYDTSNDNVTLGYFRIGDQESTIGIDLLDLPESAMDVVDDIIASTVCSILNGEFSDTPRVPAPKYSDDFAWICQDNSIVEESWGDDHG